MFIGSFGLVWLNTSSTKATHSGSAQDSHLLRTLSTFSDVKLVYKQYFISTSVEANIDITTAKRISYEYFHWLIIFLSANENNARQVGLVVL